MSDGSLVTRIRIAQPGLAIAEYRKGNTSVAIATDTATVTDVRIDDSAGSNSVTVSTADRKTSATALQPASGAARPNVIDMVISLGMDPAAAAVAFGAAASRELLSGGPAGSTEFSRAAAQAPAGGPAVVRDAVGIASRSVAAAVTPQASAARRVYYSTTCVSLAGGYKNQVTSYGCDLRYKDYVNGNDWWLADELTASGHSVDQAVWNPDRITRVQIDSKNGTGNTLSKWSPSTTATIGSCSTRSYGVTSPKSGLSYSSSEDICPNKAGPSTVTRTAFGVKWTGEMGRDDYAGIAGVAIVHSPPGASGDESVVLSEAWNG